MHDDQLLLSSLITTEASIDTTRVARITTSEVCTGICTQPEINILTPMKSRINEIPNFKYLNRFNIPARAKKRERKPSIAKRFEVIAIKESCVIASTAGIESIAKTTSVDSSNTTVMNATVA